MSAEVGAPVSRVCVVLEAPRSTVYARRGAGGQDEPAAKRGPKTPLSDEELTEAIREVIASSPFSGEGHRKVTARDTEETERPSLAAIEVSASPLASLREISSRSASDSRSGGRGAFARGRTPPDSFSQ